MKATESSVGLGVVRTLAECLQAIAHPSRFRIVQFCLEPRRFTNIILELQLNPASFKFHAKVLMDYGLIEKVERGLYKATELGKLLLDLVDQVGSLSD